MNRFSKKIVNIDFLASPKHSEPIADRSPFSHSLSHNRFKANFFSNYTGLELEHGTIMVHMIKGKLQEKNFIELDDNQAVQVPFPPGCKVIVLNQGSLQCTGEVSGVYISFEHNSSTCKKYYRVESVDAKGFAVSEIVLGDSVRYAINCPIMISSSTDRNADATTVDGVIKGFEIQDSEDESSDNHKFLYTVEVCTVSSRGDERVFRQRGIEADHIRFRPVSENIETVTNSASSFDEKTSVVSLEEQPSAALHSSFISPMKAAPSVKTHKRNTFTAPPQPALASPPPSHGKAAMMQSPTLSVSNEGTDRSLVSLDKCHPLPLPHPVHFQGTFDKNAKIPDFSFVTNFKPDIGEDGRRCCVMCGKFRMLNNGKSTKTKSMKSTSQYSFDKIVIPNQNKGVCTECDVDIWVLNKCGTQIKWCKGCKVSSCFLSNSRPTSNCLNANICYL